ncbi:uncharacterized protein LOC114351688 [Ostrinia furnacalis]|uniref:uncharacterized protein LOC114351688 n=1 Tax=Ostrinia furnacalis TaxID=93504 RepID=UPI00103B7469|nr:uncharacterized protein LOC114351688 [Ostrinia furnacalis]
MITDFAKEKVYWTRKMNLKLVRYIQTRPNIWNPKHPKYTSVEHRDRTYAEFASKYGDEFTGQAVKDRWTNIRSTFSHYLRKLNASRANDGAEEYKINWHLWEACQFLLSVNKRGQNDLSDEDDKKAIVNQEDWVSEDDASPTDNSKDNMCKSIAENLFHILQSAQNEGLNNTDSTKYGYVGRAISKTLSQMSSFDAACASQKIMEILLLYDKDNPNNPNNKNVVYL